MHDMSARSRGIRLADQIAQALDLKGRHAEAHQARLSGRALLIARIGMTHRDDEHLG